MKKNRPRTLVIRDAEKLRALRAPLRQELLQSLIGMGTATVKQLAQSVGRAPAAIYYHVHELERAGLVRTSGARRSGSRTEALYRPVAERIVIDRTVRSQAFVGALADLHRAALSRAEREITAAITRENREPPGNESTSFLRLTARLTRKDAGEARRRLNELARFMSERSRREGGELLSLTAALVKVA
jgi:DNA-binding transcriptional ArsR family regulator